ncbi:hypothetical protein [Actinomycetospora cinnamomea]|uniref:Uncharacterized protein n=1 Tax=Actinomycetospora cinnamomea TaxID=663609 RepID=A0A2U1FCW4_9PSEU|nr:hypothetical protein [Actinomycetospora cinnamomea]PVZ10035.1 hypothetical protein C8D89_105111 [Actinomycetospora cinnamomea]
MTTTLGPLRPVHGGPAPRWSPRRLGHHRYLWWLGALVLAAVAAAIAVGLDASPEPGIPDDGAVNVLTAVILVSPFLLWGLIHQFVSAVRRRVRDDVREYGVGQPVRFRPPGADDAAAGVRYLIDVDHAPAAVLVRDSRERGGPVARLEHGERRLRLRMRAGVMTAGDSSGPVFTARRSGPAGRRSWEITADGARLRFEVRGGHPVPRRTLVDAEGVAWLVRIGRPRAGGRGRVHPDARVPERLSPAGAAFCVLVLAELDAKIRAARDAPLTGGSGDGDSSWTDTGSSDSGGGDGGGGGGSGGDGGGGGGGGGGGD